MLDSLTAAPIARRHLPLLLALLVAAPALAQWSDDPAQNLTLADLPGGQNQPKLVATADGGFYVSWFGGPGYDVYLQRLDATGSALWDEGGLRIADRDFSSTEDYGLGVDADGNALVVFRFPDGEGNTQAVVSRVSPEGDLLWGEPGVFASADPSAAASPRVTGTPDGGAVVAWTSFDTGGIVLQKLDAAGDPLWGEDGVGLTTPTGFFFLADLHADADGNVVVSGSAQLSTFDRQLWAQKLDGDGAPLWGEDPVEVFDGSDGALQFGYFPSFVPDGEGGAVFAWYQVGGIGEARVRVQRVLDDGALAFGQNGVDVGAGTDVERGAPSAAFDATTGDVYVLWPQEQQVGTERTYGVAAQRITEAGARAWGDAGVTLVPMGDVQASQAVALPAPDGAFFAWSLGSAPAPSRIEAARLDADGAFVWDEEVVPLKTSATESGRMRGALSADGFAAYVWADGSPASASVKAQNLNPDGTLGPAGTPVASVEPQEVALTLAEGETASATVTLANLGSGALTYEASVLRPDFVLEDFEDGENEYGLTLGIPQIETIEPSGGNPGRWLRNNGLSTFAPALYLLDEPFTGDYVERGVSAISVDAQTLDVSITVEGRPFSLQLTRFNGEPDNPEVHDYVYFLGELVPQPGEGWQSYTFEIPSDFEGELPEGWMGGYYGDPESLPPGVVWQDILREVDLVEVMWGHPAMFYILQDFDIGVDNLRFDFADATPGPLTVTPTEGAVAPGAEAELTLEVDAADLDEGTYVFDLRLATNDAEHALVTVPVTVTVTGGVSNEDGAVPTALALRPNFPNPFAGATTIELALPRAEHVTLAVYDVTGRRVATLVDRPLEAGTHRVRWDAAGLAAGAYLVRMQAGDGVRTRRALVVR